MSAETISTTQLARLLHVRPAELRAAAARLGLVPGVEVVTRWNGPDIMRLWPPEWIDDIRAEIERGERFDWTQVV